MTTFRTCGDCGRWKPIRTVTNIGICTLVMPAWLDVRNAPHTSREDGCDFATEVDE